MKQFFLIGKGIGASLSPQIHQRIYHILGENAQYGLLDLPDLSAIKKADLLTPQAVLSSATTLTTSQNDAENCKNSLEIGGFNVTTPFKTAILELVDCDFSGCKSVNTLKIVDKNDFSQGSKSLLDTKSAPNHSTKTNAIEPNSPTKSKEIYGNNSQNIEKKQIIEGYSTDGMGFILDAKRLSLDLSRVAIVGYGGAAKSIIFQLNSLNSQVCVQSRHKNANIYSEFIPTLTINCSGSDLDECPSQVYDLRYRGNQCGTTSGLGMLIYQAILADEIFFDKKIDLQIFKEIYGIFT